MAADRRRLIVVSNRGPVVHGRDDAGRLVARRGGGGLVTALDSLAAEHDVIWIASALSDEDRVVAAEAGGAFEERSRSGSAFRLRLLDHDREAYARYYNVVANPVLWFIQHGLWDASQPPVAGERLEEAWTTGYAIVNRSFADAVLSELEADPDATVFFHDYHLYLAPRMVRDQAPDATLAHFVHIPWVGADVWSVLPAHIREAIHEGLLANDLAGFHSERWRRSFAEACVSLAGAEAEGTTILQAGRRTATTAHPISVDPAEFDALATSGPVLEREGRIRTDQDEKLVVRVDRTDPSKNILRGLEAFELLLERHPEHRGRVRMVALLDPSRQDIAEYASYTASIVRLAAAVNARAGAPVVDLRIEDDFPLSVAAYKQYDVLLVNPTADGLNLVAKEGPLINERDGVLVLSRGAGAADELGRWAVTVDPLDVSGQAEALHHALVMPAAERRARLEGIRAQVREHDVSRWVAALMADLDRIAAGRRG